MVEVEIRGKLTAQTYQALKQYLGRHGKLVRTQTREMILLYNYPGYAKDPLNREVDIRLRNTDGDCEIMLKLKATDHNVGRIETSLKLRDTSLDNAREIVRAFGCLRGLEMHRSTEAYVCDGIEWSLVSTPKNHQYFEAELSVSEAEVELAHKRLVAEAERLGLEPLGPEAMRDFILFLDQEVNKEIDI
jgi:hypothetical protein